MNVAISILCVAAGGSIGALLRFVLAKNLDSNEIGFPLGTFTANMLASFILGVLVALAGANDISQTMQIFLETGFCATLSTFSSLALQLAQMLRQRRLLMCSFYFISTFTMGMALFLLAEQFTF